jgi:shikimate dehydrogenase
MLTITAKSSLCLVIGDPISHSLSPAMHNAGYAAAHLPYVMAAAHVTPAALPQAVQGMRALGVRGLAVTMPHKNSIIPLLDSVDPIAHKIGAVNTIVQEEGKLIGYNTDWLGILKPIERHTPLTHKRVAIIGAGGAAQAAAFAALHGGAAVTIFNRTRERAANVAARFGCQSKSFDTLHDVSEHDIIINTTSVGMTPHEGESPLPLDVLRAHHLIFETIYAPATTELLRLGASVGATVIQGRAMFLEQGVAQFELHTGIRAPVEVMEQVLL